VAVIGGVALAAIVLCNHGLALRVFGEMDAEWRESILQTSSFNFPSGWGIPDWCYFAVQLVILAVAIVKMRSVDAVRTRFLVVLLLVTLASTVGALLGGLLPYALLLQGQAYRALWLLAVLHFGLAFWLCRTELAPHQDERHKFLGCALLAYLCWTDWLAVEWA